MLFERSPYPGIDDHGRYEGWRRRLAPLLARVGLRPGIKPAETVTVAERLGGVTIINTHDANTGEFLGSVSVGNRPLRRENDE
jgi:hypothetical protein